MAKNTTNKNYKQDQKTNDKLGNTCNTYYVY